MVTGVISALVSGPESRASLTDTIVRGITALGALGGITAMVMLGKVNSDAAVAIYSVVLTHIFGTAREVQRNQQAVPPSGGTE